MLQGLMVIGVVAAAVLIGQSYPLLGGIIAMFPLKMFAYTAASNPEVLAQSLKGLVVGSLGSLACALAMYFTLRYGASIAIVSGLAAWSAFALRAGLF